MSHRTESGTSRARDALGDAMLGATPAEQRLLAATAEPANVGKSVRAVCRRAKVSPDTYYRLMLDADFQGRFRRAQRESLGDLSGPINALKKSALLPGRDGAQDRKTLFTMSGHLVHPSLKFEQKTQVNVNLNVDRLPKYSHILWVYLQMKLPPEKWLPAIRDQYEAGVLLPEELPTPMLMEPEPQLSEGPQMPENTNEFDRQNA